MFKKKGEKESTGNNLPQGRRPRETGKRDGEASPPRLPASPASASGGLAASKRPLPREPTGRLRAHPKPEPSRSLDEDERVGEDVCVGEGEWVSLDEADARHAAAGPLADPVGEVPGLPARRAQGVAAPGPAAVREGRAQHKGLAHGGQGQQDDQQDSDSAKGSHCRCSETL